MIKEVRMPQAEYFKAFCEQEQGRVKSIFTKFSEFAAEPSSVQFQHRYRNYFKPKAPRISYAPLLFMNREFMSPERAILLLSSSGVLKLEEESYKGTITYGGDLTEKMSVQFKSIYDPHQNTQFAMSLELGSNKIESIFEVANLRRWGVIVGHQYEIVRVNNIYTITHMVLNREWLESRDIPLLRQKRIGNVVLPGVEYA